MTYVIFEPLIPVKFKLHRCNLKSGRRKLALVVSNVPKCPSSKKFVMETFGGEGSLSDSFAGSYRMLSIGF